MKKVVLLVAMAAAGALASMALASDGSFWKHVVTNVTTTQTTQTTQQQGCVHYATHESAVGSGVDLNADLWYDNSACDGFAWHYNHGNDHHWAKVTQNVVVTVPVTVTNVETVCNTTQEGNVGGPFVDENCTQPVQPPAHNYVLTLRANGGLSAVIPNGGTVMYSGAYTDNGDPVSGSSVSLTVYGGYMCTGSPVFGPTSYFTTDSGGLFSAPSGATSTGQYSAQVNVGSTESNCVNVGVGNVTPPPAASVTLPPQENNVFLCYSAFQTTPGVWNVKEAPGLIAQGYWHPYAVAGNVEGGTNIGTYHLVCNLATGQAAGQQFAALDGYLTGIDQFTGVSGAIGWYPVVP